MSATWHVSSVQMGDWRLCSEPGRMEVVDHVAQKSAASWSYPDRKPLSIAFRIFAKDTWNDVQAPDALCATWSGENIHVSYKGCEWTFVPGNKAVALFYQGRSYIHEQLMAASDGRASALRYEKGRMIVHPSNDFYTLSIDR